MTDSIEELLDDVVTALGAGDEGAAVRRYVEGTGVSRWIARDEVRKLRKGLLDDSDDGAVDRFEAGARRVLGVLGPGEAGAAASPPPLGALPRFLAVAHALLAITTTVVLAVGVGLSVLVGPGAGKVAAGVLAAPQFLLFPGAMALLARRWPWLDRVPDRWLLGYGVLLGASHLVVALVWVDIGERVLWAWRAPVVEAAAESAALAAARDGAIVHLPASRVLAAPEGAVSRTVRFGAGGSTPTAVTRTWTVAPLAIGPGTGGSRGGERCAWIGETDERPTLAFANLGHADPSPYLAALPDRAGNYLAAVASALRTPASACAVVLTRLPPPPELRRQLGTRLSVFLVTLHGIPPLALVMLAAVRGWARPWMGRWVSSGR